MNSRSDDVIKKVLDHLDVFNEIQTDVITQRLDLEQSRLERKDLVKNLHIPYQKQDPRKLHGKMFMDTCLFPPKMLDDGLEDTADVTELKVKALSQFLMKSKNTVIYTEVFKKEETKHDISFQQHEHIPESYKMISKLAQEGMFQVWIQTGHDGLPQNADFHGPVYEVYDSWKDLENETYKQIMDKVDNALEESDLIVILVHNTQLKTSATKKIYELANHDFRDFGKALGIVLISNQESYLDEILSLKINCSQENVFHGVLDSLDIEFDCNYKNKDEIKKVAPGLQGRIMNPDEASDCPEYVIETCDINSHRDSITDILHRFPSIEITDPKIRDGRLFIENENISTHHILGEHTDEESPEEVELKIQTILTMFQLSKNSIICTDAKNEKLEEHCAFDSCLFSNLNEENQTKVNFLKVLKNKNLVQSVIQIGHDGIPQKAGYGEEDTFEMYLDWLGNDLFTQEKENLEKLANEADFILFLSDNINTSMASLAITKISEKSKSGLRFEDGGALGFGLVGTKTSSQSGLASVRVNTTISSFISKFLESIGDEDVGELERRCTAAEHRNFFRYIISQKEIEEGVHGFAYHNLM